VVCVGGAGVCVGWVVWGWGGGEVLISHSVVPTFQLWNYYVGLHIDSKYCCAVSCNDRFFLVK
jgi:hypothetical protein